MEIHTFPRRTFFPVTKKVLGLPFCSKKKSAVEKNNSNLEG